MGTVLQSHFKGEMGVTRKSLFVIAVAGAIFAICSVEIEARRPRPNGGRPSRNCTSDDDCGRRVCNIETSTCVRCNVDDDCTSPNRNTCDNTRCVRSCASDDECRGRKGVCNTDTSRCVMCNVDADCTNGNRNTCENNRCVRTP